MALAKPSRDWDWVWHAGFGCQAQSRLGLASATPRILVA